MEPILTIEMTIQAAIGRAAATFEDTEGEHIDILPPARRWELYRSELDYMGQEWGDWYPLANELSGLHPNVLARLWNNLTA